MNIIFNFLNGILNGIFHCTGDWGVAIIVLTIMVKLLLLPMSFRQRVSMSNQQKISEKIQDIKVKYKDNAEKVKSETEKYYADSKKSLLGCSVSLLQIPIIYSLYHVVTRIPFEAGTMIVPWMSSIKIPDKYYILPLAYVILSIIPNLLPYLPYLKAAYNVKTSKTNIISSVIISLLIIIKAPIGVGMYFISTSLFSLFEEIAFRIYLKNRISVKAKMN